MRDRIVGLAAIAALASACVTSTAAAEQRFAVQATVAEGISTGDGGDSVVVRRAPMFAELGLTSWSTDDDAWWLGGAVRMEFETLTSFGGVFRVGLNANLEMLHVRPYVAFATILAPSSLFGAEAGADVALALFDSFRVLARVFVDAYFAGDDLPQDSVIITFAGALGVEVVF